MDTEDGNTEPDTDTESQHREGEELIADISDHLRQSLATSGDSVLNALKVMAANLHAIKTSAALVSALVTFGKGTVHDTSLLVL